MNALWLKLDNQQQYTDNKLGRLFATHCEREREEAMVVFRDHMVIVRHEKPLSESAYWSFDSGKAIFFNDGTVDVEEFHKERSDKHESHKYIGYFLMLIFRDYYPELKEVDFPVHEMRIAFLDDIESYVDFIFH